MTRVIRKSRIKELQINTIELLNTAPITRRNSTIYKFCKYSSENRTRKENSLTLYYIVHAAFYVRKKRKETLSQIDKSHSTDHKNVTQTGTWENQRKEKPAVGSRKETQIHRSH